jgi:hypothetical protein
MGEGVGRAVLRVLPMVRKCPFILHNMYHLWKAESILRIGVKADNESTIAMIYKATRNLHSHLKVHKRGLKGL